MVMDETVRTITLILKKRDTGGGWRLNEVYTNQNINEKLSPFSGHDD